MKRLEGFFAGINFGGWFSQCDYSLDRLDNFIREEDFAIVKKWGFDHVRVPVDYNVFEEKDGTFIEAGFDRVQRVIDLCRKNELHMILDLHKTMGFSFDAGEKECGLFEDEKYQDMFYALWREFAKRFSKNSDMLAFELLNEVTEKEYMPTWNKIATRTISIIREYSSDIKILVGGFHNNAAEAVPYIDVPLDGNIVLNFHCYEPLMFTHQGAYWIPTMDTAFRMPYRADIKTYRKVMTGVMDHMLPTLDGIEETKTPDIDFFKKLFAPAIQRANELDAYLYCGEYGVIELADAKDAAEWFRDIHQVFEEYGIGHALWSYREMDFDFSGTWMDSFRDKIIAESKGQF